MNEWQTVAIAEIADKIAMGPFGSNIKVSTFVGEGIPIISGQHLHGTRLNESSGYNFITGEHAERLRNSNVFPGDIVFTHAGTIGQVALIPEGAMYERYVISQRQFYLRVNRERANPAFVTRWFHAPLGKHRLMMHASQVGVPSISRPASNLKEIQIDLPPLEDQEAITKLLDVLDDKIELNRKTAATLEEMARTLYRSWFVDFDPVRARAEGRAPAHMDPTTAALFPDSFGEDGLPVGWLMNTIGEVGEIVGGSTPSTKNDSFWVGGIHAWATPKDLSNLGQAFLFDTERKVTSAGLAKITSGLSPAGTLLLSSRAPIGYLALTTVPVAINQGFIAIRETENIFGIEAYFWCAENMDLIHANANGSTFQEISKKNFRPLAYVLAPTSVRNAFNEQADLWFARMRELMDENRTLATLRDTLLPRLMSGELLIRNTEKQVKEAI